jgi:excisionase family DNA binding protein
MTHLTIREASRLIGRTPATIRRYIRSGRLKAEKEIGKFGEEYRIQRDDLLALGFTPAEPGAESLPAPLVRAPGAAAMVVASPDAVPVSLYNELLMKHEQILVQYGMIRAGGQKLLEYKADSEAKAEELRKAQERFQALRQRALQEITLLRKRVREMEIRVEERNIEVTLLKEQVKRLEQAPGSPAAVEPVEAGFFELRLKQQSVAEMLGEEARPIATQKAGASWPAGFPPLDRKDDH